MLSNKTQRSYCMTLSNHSLKFLWFLTDVFSFFLCIDIWSFKKWVAYLTKSKFKAREKNVILMNQELRTLQFVTPTGTLWLEVPWAIIFFYSYFYHNSLFFFLSFFIEVPSTCSFLFPHFILFLHSPCL